MGLAERIRGFMGYPEDEYYEDEEETRRPVTPKAQEREAVSAARSAASDTGMEAVLVKPERFEDASTIAEHLNANRIIVLNLESASREVSRRLIDFLSGAAYAKNGQIRRVATNTYIITPYDVDIMNGQSDELDMGSYF